MQDMLYKAADFLYGCHPYHNFSLVATVGATRPKAVFYGNNRADFSFIPGNVAHLENLTILKTTTTGHFSGDKMKELLAEIPSI